MKKKALLQGSWYPSNAKECELFIKESLKDYKVEKNARGAICPHAGWFFSGALASKAINNLSKSDIIVLFGMHLHISSKAVLLDYDSFETPFGDIKTDRNLFSNLNENFDFHIENTPFFQENTIEILLPFIKYFFKDAKILVIGLPPSKVSIDISKYVFEILNKDKKNFNVIASCDLTHYGANFSFAPKGFGEDAYEWVKNTNDAAFIQAVKKKDHREILKVAEKFQNACCPGAVAGAVNLLNQKKINKIKLIGYGNSYEKSKSDSFVGYASFNIY